MANKKVSQLTSKPSVLTTDLFPIADPSTGQLFKTTISDLGTAIGSGVSSVNGLVGAVVLDTDDIQELASPVNKWYTDLRARAAISVSSPLLYNSGTGLITIQQASGSQNGYLSSTDWTTFNTKQAALSGTGFVKISGTTISYDNSTYLTTSAAASTYLALSGGTLTGALNGTSATFTGDLTISSANPRIYLTDTDNNPDYFISNTDGTFTIYDVTNSLSRFTIGTTGNANFRNAIIGGGSITGESIYSNGIVSVGTSLSVGTTITAGSSITATRLILSGGTSPTGLYFGHTDRVVLANYTVGGGMDFETNGGIVNMTLFSSGNLGVGAGLTDDGTNKLQIAGSIISSGDHINGTIANNGVGKFKGSFTSVNTSSSLAKVQFGGGEGSQFRAYMEVRQVWNGSSTDQYLGFTTFKGGVGSAEVLTINGAGAATFSSTSNVPILIKSSSGSNTSYLYSANAGSSSDYQVAYGSLNNDASIVAGGSTKMTITSAGNVGINTTSPTQRLEVVSNNVRIAANDTANGTAGFFMRVLNGGTQVGNATVRTDNAGLFSIFTGTTGETQALNITSSGNVGIGTTSPGVKLTVFTSGQSFTSSTVTYSAGSSQGLLLDNSAGTSQSGNAIWFANSGLYSAISSTRVDTGTWGTDLRFYTHPDAVTNQYDVTERMRITSGGNVTIGDSSTSNTAKLNYASPGVGSYNGVLELYHSTSNVSGSGYMNFYVNSSVIGSIGQVGSTAVAYYTTSDYRLKEDLKPINGLEIVNKIKVYDYKWKAEDSRMDGVLAHELQEILPYAVTGEKDGERMQGVDYSKIVPVMVQAIKEEDAKIIALQNKVIELETEIQTLKNK